MVTATAKQTQVNSATLVMGVTGSGKSSLARTMAEFLWEQHKKILYYYNCDGGGFPAKVQEGIALGIIKGFRMRTRDPGDLGLAFETCYRAAQGWWPRRINPRTCQVEPGVEMVPPIAKRLEMYCPNDHLVKTVTIQSQLTPGKCPTCAVMVTAQNMRVVPTMTHSKGFEDRGGCFFDGLSSMLSWELMEMGQRAGRLELKGEEGAIGGKIISGDMKFGGTTRSHVGFAQTRGEELAHLALGIPNLILPPVFTALSMEASDEGNLSIIGPKIAGRAKTDEAPQWFGNCLEAAKIPAETGSGEQFVLYLSEFTDGQGRRHLLKNRAAPGTMPDRLVDPPNGEAPFKEFNLGRFFQLLDDALTSGIEQAKQQYPDAPGVPDEVVEYGDGGKATPAAQAQDTAAPGLTGPQTMKAAAPTTAGPATTTTTAPAAPAAPKPAVQRPRTAGAPKAAAPSKPPAAQTAASATPAVTDSPSPEPAAPVTTAPVSATPAPPAVAATPAPAAPAAPRPAGVAPPAGARPGVARPAAAAGPAPRPPAAAPRPPAARPVTPPGTGKA